VPGSPPLSSRGLGWMVLAQVCFAAMNVCTRQGSSHLPWAEIAAGRFLVGALLAVAVAAARGTSLRTTDRAGTWRRSGFGTVAAVGSFYALGSDRITVGDVATLVATAPIFVAILSGPLLGEPVSRRIWLAVLLAFAGVFAVVRPSFAIAAPVAAVATGGAGFYALAMIALRRIGPGESHEAVVLHFSLVGLATMVTLALPHWRWPDTAGGLLLLGAGLGGGGAQLAMTRAYALDRAAPVTALSSLGIVFTHLFALALPGEQPGPSRLLGAALVIGASFLVAARRPRRDMFLP